jgi:lipoprotein LprG
VRRARLLRGVVAVLLLVMTPALLTSCSSGNHQKTKNPKAVLAQAKANLDATSGVHVRLSTAKLPTGLSGLLEADGVGTHDPAFEGTIKVSLGGVVADAEVVATGGQVYAKLPFTTKFTKIDPSRYGAPDPASLMTDSGGLSSLLTSAKNVKEGKQVRDGKRVLTTYTATVPGKAVAAVIPSADSTASFDATFTVDDKFQLSEAVLTGPFYPKAGNVTYKIEFSDYGTKKNIKAP